MLVALISFDIRAFTSVNGSSEATLLVREGPLNIVEFNNEFLAFKFKKISYREYHLVSTMLEVLQ